MNVLGYIQTMAKTFETHFTLPTRFKCRYGLRTVRNPKELILLLHGFELTGPGMLARFEKALQKNAILLAPNGPFPVRHVDGDHMSLGFSWYFFEPGHEEFYTPRDLSIRYLKRLISSLGLSYLPKRIIGYSQGGYLGPFVAQELTKVQQLVGISCRFLGDEIRRIPKFRMDAIHGSKDAIVDAKLSVEAFSKLKTRGMSGEFHLLKGLGHRVVPPMLQTLERVLAESSHLI